MSETVRTRARRAQLTQFLRQLPGILSGRLRDSHGIAAGFRSRVAWTFFSLVAPAFNQKGRGIEDPAGNRWLPNTPEYLAYQKGRARQKNIRTDKRQANWEAGGTGYRTHRRGHLSPAQFRQWKKDYQDALGKLAAMHPLKLAKGMAANAAWAASRKNGAPTLLETYGHKPDQVLVDEGTLRRSLQVGEIVEAGARASYRTAGIAQVFRQPTGEIVVGSKAPTASYHHNARRTRHGQPGKGTIRRRLWPERFPADWWRQIVGQTRGGIARLKDLIRSGAIQ